LAFISGRSAEAVGEEISETAGEEVLGKEGKKVNPELHTYTRGILHEIITSYLMPLEVFTVRGHEFAVTPTGDTGVNSGRPRHRVECRTCKTVEHENTNWAASCVLQHLKWMRS